MTKADSPGRAALERAAEVAHSTVREWLEAHELPERVVFCCFSEADREVYERVAARALSD